MATHTKAGLEEAISAFLDYLGSYRGHSRHTVKAYARDVRRFREFLAKRYRQVQRPDQVRRKDGTVIGYR
jgi:site-specific recombinase XerD